MRSIIVAMVALLSPVWAQAGTPFVQIPIHSEPGFYVHERGVAVLTALGDKTAIVVKIRGVPPGAVQPMHVHKGRCGALDPTPAWPLTPLTSQGVSRTTIPVALKSLMARSYAINIHESVRDLTVYVACGNVPKAPR